MLSHDKATGQWVTKHSKCHGNGESHLGTYEGDRAINHTDQPLPTEMQLNTSGAHLFLILRKLSSKVGSLFFLLDYVSFDIGLVSRFFPPVELFFQQLCTSKAAFFFPDRAWQNRSPSIEGPKRSFMGGEKQLRM